MKNHIPMPPLSKPLTVRFWSKTAVGLVDLCWTWMGTLNNCNYGDFKWNGTIYKAHRIAHYISTKVDPAERLVLHGCDNPSCVNPAHLRSGTQKENGLDMSKRCRCSDRRGSLSHRAKLTDSQVEQIILRGKTERQRVLAKEFGISQSQIHRILSGSAWSNKVRLAA